MDKGASKFQSGDRGGNVHVKVSMNQAYQHLKTWRMQKINKGRVPLAYPRNRTRPILCTVGEIVPLKLFAQNFYWHYIILFLVLENDGDTCTKIEFSVEIQVLYCTRLITLGKWDPICSSSFLFRKKRNFFPPPFLHIKLVIIIFPTRQCTLGWTVLVHAELENFRCEDSIKEKYELCITNTYLLLYFSI